jgi:hypothetical protein
MTERSRSPRRVDRDRVAADERPAAEASEPVAAKSSPHSPLRPVAKAVLFLAFAFTIMADPVSSVAYTIEASLRALHGHLGLLMATQLIVLAIILLVDVNYWQLVARFPLGGGSAEAAARAFGTGWAFIPIGALIVDFILTITISVAAAVSALISYVPSLASLRIVLGLALLAVVAGLTWFGHRGRLTFGVMTLLSPLLAVLLTFPVAMALATGTEAPATAIGQLGQLGPDDRRRFARGDLALTLLIVAGLTVGLTGLAVRLHVGIPGANSTQIADVARAASGSGLSYGLFQATSALLLLAAASSSFQAGPGLLKALSRHPHSAAVGILPRGLGETNRHHTPYWSVAVYLAVSAVVLIAAAGQEQKLVLVYAVAVFVSFLAGLTAMVVFSLRDRRLGLAAVNVAGAVAVAFTLLVNLARGYPLLSMAATAAIAVSLYTLWVRAGRPAGYRAVERHPDDDDQTRSGHDAHPRPKDARNPDHDANDAVRHPRETEQDVHVGERPAQK